MSNEWKFWSIANVCIAAGFIAFCVAAKGCNDSDNAAKVRLAERGCSYLGDSRFICGTLSPTSQAGQAK